VIEPATPRCFGTTIRTRRRGTCCRREFRTKGIMPERAGRAGGRSDTELIETEFSDPIAEVRLLRRQVQRERARRRAAESLGERVTRDLYESVRQLRSAQSELLERADRSRVVNELARSLRHDHDTGRLLQRAA